MKQNRGYTLPLTLLRNEMKSGKTDDSSATSGILKNTFLQREIIVALQKAAKVMFAVIQSLSVLHNSHTHTASDSTPDPMLMGQHPGR